MDTIDLDDLIARLQARVADPERRLDVRPRAFDQEVAGLSLGDLLGQGRGLASQLRRVVDANQAGRPLGSDLTAKVDRIAAALATPAAAPLPASVSPATLDAVERDLGFDLPLALRRVYGEVADGGFGPGSGLLGLSDVITTYHRYRVDPPMAPAGATWPIGLLPIRRYDVGVDAVEAGSGQMIGWDPESLTERSGVPAWHRTFTALSDSFERWLDDWVRAPTLDERMAASTGARMIEDARNARAHIATLSPQEREAMGLPEVGWEAEVWGGLGYEPDER